MNNQTFFDIATLQYRLKNMTQKVKEFESGEKYAKMRREFESVFREQNRTIKRRESELYSLTKLIAVLVDSKRAI